MPLDVLDPLGLPPRWAMIVAAAVAVGRLVSLTLGLTGRLSGYELLLSVIFGGIAGNVVGILRRRSGKQH